MRALSPVEAWTKYDAVEARLTASVSERMLDLGAVGPDMHVLDLATGRGEPAIRAARRVGPGGRVVGTDVSASMLAFARAAAVGTALELRVLDAQTGEGLEAATFDVVTTRWGLMYMPEPVRALDQARRALKPGGVLVAALWAEPERVEWATFTRHVLARYCAVPPLDLAQPGACHYGSRAVIERDFSGFRIEHVEEMFTPVIASETAAGIADWCIDLGFARLASELPAAARATSSAESRVSSSPDAERTRGRSRIRRGSVLPFAHATPGGRPATRAPGDPRSVHVRDHERAEHRRADEEGA